MKVFEKKKDIYVEENCDSEQTAFIDKNAENTKRLNKDLDIRHLVFLAVGGSIGTGLFINSGSALNLGGPASLVLDWGLVATCFITVMNALGELAATYPVNGGFNVYFDKFLDPSVAFAVNINYVLQWAVLLPLELVAASMTIQYWNDKLNPDIFVAVFFAVIVVINFMDVKIYGEVEVVLSMIKLLAIVGFFILGIVLICGGTPEGHYIGNKYWREKAFVGAPGVPRFKNICSNFVVAFFSYSGVESCCLAAAESKNSHKTLPKSSKRTFWLVTLSYMSILTLIGFLIPYDDPRLLGGSNSVDATASPLVIAIENGGIKGLSSLMNAIILIAVLSVANSSVYACSRSLASMAQLGNVPSLLGKVDKRGRPMNAILVTLFIGLLSFVAASDKQEEVFTYLSALSGLSTLFLYFSINLSHLRFRYAMKVQNKSLDSLPYKSMTGIWGSVYGCVVLVLIFIASWWTSLEGTKIFFQSFASLFVLIGSYLGHKIYSRRWTKYYIKGKDIDLDTGKRDIDEEVFKQEILLEKQNYASYPWYKKFFEFWC